MLGNARRLRPRPPAGPRPPMSPAGLRSLARSRRPAQNRPGAPEPGAGRPRAAKEAEHSRSGACLCLHGFSPLWQPWLPLFPATSFLGCPHHLSNPRDGDRRGPNPILSQGESHASFIKYPPAGLGPSLAQQSSSGEGQGCGGLSPGSQARGPCLRFPCTQWPSIQTLAVVVCIQK